MPIESLTHTKPAFVDQRGSIWNVFTESNPSALGVRPPSYGLELRVHHVAVIHSTQGAVRGNHYHKAETQYLFVVLGRVQSRCRDVRTGETGTLLAEVGDIIETLPYVAHRMEFLEPTMLLAAYTAARMTFPNKDTYPFDLSGMGV